jgi:hypothetical protein
VVNGVLNTPLNGNMPINQSRLQFVLVNLQVAPGDTMWLRWTDYNSDSFDDGLAIDSVQVTALQNYASTTISFVNQKQTFTEVDGTVQIPLELKNGNSFSSQVEVFMADTGTVTINRDLSYVSSNTKFQPGDTVGYVNLLLNREEPFETQEYFVLGIRNLGNATEGSIQYDTIYINNYDYPQVAVANLKTSNTQGIADSLNGRFTVSGVVHGVNYSTSGGSDFYLIDGNEGINIYAVAGKLSYQPTAGDELKIWGQLSQFRGLTRLENIDSVQLLDTNRTLAVAAKVSSLSENTESDFVSLENITLYPAISTFPFNQAVTAITATNDTVELFISSQTDVAGMVAPAIPFTINGIGSQFADYNAPFAGGYRLMVMSGSQSSLSLNQSKSQLLTVYPNPFKDELNVLLPEAIITVEILNLNGQVLKSMQPNGNNVQLNLSDLANGSYVLKVVSPSGVSIQKIVK